MKIYSWTALPCRVKPEILDVNQGFQVYLSGTMLAVNKNGSTA
jgi:hypothetical protein